MFPVRKSFLYLFLLTVITTSIKCNKLNKPRILLPIFNDFSSHFTLEATEGGCYEWSTTRQDLIEIIPLNEDPVHKCSTRVNINTITKEMARNMAVILAEDVHTKQMLRSDVIVDVIHSIAISTTTRELFMEQAPENFEVIAYDDQGNEFSTLEGVEFNWNIQSTSQSQDIILRYITYRDSRYETPHAIADLEDNGRKGYKILLEGIKSGSATVSVQLPYPEYKHVQPCKVLLIVVANLLLSPAEVYMMPGDVINFKIFYLNNGYMKEVALLDSQYYLKADNDAILTTNQEQVKALNIGTAKILLHDRNIVETDPGLKLPSAIVHVVMPEYLVINILPHKNWAILIGDYHQINVEVYSKTGHKLHIGNDAKIDLNVNQDYFVIKSQSSNGSWANGYGAKVGTVTVMATLNNNEYFENKVTEKHELLIYPLIRVNPSLVILPWDPMLKPRYDVLLTAEGGDGKFSWSSSDPSIGVVSQSGYVHTITNGEFYIAASMQQNHNNKHSSRFLILPPNRLEIVDYLVETEIGKTIYLYIALYININGTSMPFTKCQQFPFQIKQSNEKFVYNRSDIVPNIGISCGNIALLAIDAGLSKITVYYEYDNVYLEDSVTLNAFKPLSLLQPKENVVLAVGSAINLVYTGGPRPFVGHSNDFQRTVVSSDEDLVQVIDETNNYKFDYDEDYTVLNVLCKKYGETDIKLMIVHLPICKNCKIETNSVLTHVTCSKPVQILLKPELQIVNPDNCPMDLNSGSIMVHRNENLHVEVLILNENDDKLLNISSLKLKWNVEPQKGIQILNKNNAFPKNLSVGSVDIAFKSYQLLHIQENAENAILSVMCLNDDGSSKPIMTSLQLLVVNHLQISPKQLQIFNHPDNKRTINTKHGSGFIEISTNIENLAKIKYNENRRQVDIIPLRSGELIVEVRDLCLISEAINVQINIISIEYIRTEMIDKVEVGKSVECIVRLYDINNNLITQTNLIDIKAIFDKFNIASIQEINANRKQSDNGEIHFTLTGNEIGETKLIFLINNGQKEISSSPINVQVFEPLKLYPSNSTLLIGSILQLKVHGGPQSETNIIFETENNKYVDVNDNGIVKGRKIGVSKIYAKSVGTHPTTGASIEYSKVSAEVHVVELVDIKIEAPLTRFEVGAIVPFWCYGLPNISPITLGSIDSDMNVQFLWHAEDNTLVKIRGIFHKLGVELKPKDQLSIELVALKPGKTHLILNVTVPGSILNKPYIPLVTLTSQIEIEIIPSFHLVEPKYLPNLQHLLIAPFSKVQLKTNLDNTLHNFTYSLLNTLPSTESLSEKSIVITNNVITLSKTGLVESFGTLGHALVIISTSDVNNIVQNILIAIEIKPIHYINVDLNANWRIKSSIPLHYVPLGSKFNLQLNYYDNLGNKFDAGPNDIKYQLNRDDLINIQSDSTQITIYTKSVGTTLFKFILNDVQKSVFYLKIFVEQSIKPTLDYLIGGEVICLQTPVVDENAKSGEWFSSDESLIRFDGNFKHVAFVGERSGDVILTYSLLPSSPLAIQVNNVDKIEVQANNLQITNGHLDYVNYFPVTLRNNLKQRKNINDSENRKCLADALKNSIPTAFKCFIEFTNTSTQVSVNDLFDFTPGWILETGQYACKLIDKGVNNVNIATLQSNLTILVTTENGEIDSTTLNVEFIPNFYAPKEIFMSDNINEAVLDVIGTSTVLDKLKVKPGDENLLYINSGSRISETNMRYKVQLIDSYWSSDNKLEIFITSPLTRQTESVLLKVSGNNERQMCYSNRSPLVDLLISYKNTFVVIVVLLAILIPTVYFYTHYMQTVVNVNLNPNRIGSTPQASPIYYNRLSTATPTMSPNVSNIGHSFNSTFTREPIYGEASSFYNSTTVNSRRSR